MDFQISANKTILKTYVGFFLSGFLLLSIGAIMPDLIKNFNLTYSRAGFLLSMYSLGNICANIFFPIVADKITIKKSAILFILAIPLAYLAMYFFQDSIKGSLWLIFLIIGIGMGAVPLISTNIINDLSKDKVVGTNIMHTAFAFGALAAPFTIVLLKRLGLSFEEILLFISTLMFGMWLLFATINYDYKSLESKDDSSEAKDLDFYFVSVAFVLFFYLGVENVINGWLMTYLQGMDVLSEAFSASMVSLTWIMIMVGRIFTAYRAKKTSGPKLVLIYAFGVALMILSLTITRNPSIITLTVLALGFFLAGIFPTSVSNASDYVKGNTKRLSVLFTSATVGGIFTPQIVGWVADKTTILFAMNVLLVNVLAMIIFAFITFKLYGKSK